MPTTVPSISGTTVPKTSERTPKFREKDAVCIELKATPAESKSEAAAFKRYQAFDVQISAQLWRDKWKPEAPRLSDVVLAYRQNQMRSGQQPGGFSV